MTEQARYLPSARRPRPGRPPKSRHVSGTSPVQSGEKTGGNGSALAWHTVAPIPPRLLDLEGTAAYLGVSQWTVRDLEAAGSLHRVRIPLANGGELRKLLFDREDLDRLVELWKDRAR